MYGFAPVFPPSEQHIQNITESTRWEWVGNTYGRAYFGSPPRMHIARLAKPSAPIQYRSTPYQEQRQLERGVCHPSIHEQSSRGAYKLLTPAARRAARHGPSSHHPLSTATPSLARARGVHLALIDLLLPGSGLRPHCSAAGSPPRRDTCDRFVWEDNGLIFQWDSSRGLGHKGRERS
ncbi:hypothetical protein NUW54_g6244 [Trametes sanguinea]|uniref:Uncharacterized protein n=1 Tax=Trametes sanguinea TaxID=158606 RepID=A0ACC1PU88_9APHY|nr:hypothetical protein NUW54_g6244 [Trametes sanguinea]